MSVFFAVPLAIILVLPFYVYSDATFSPILVKGFFKVALIAILIIFSAFMRVKYRKNSEPDIVILYLFTFLAVLSISYSSNPGISAFRAIDLLGFIFFAKFVSTRLENFENSVKFIELCLYVYLIGFVLVALGLHADMMRPMGGDGVTRLGGFIINPNVFAYCLILLMVINIYFFNDRSKLVFVISTLILFFLLTLTYSRSAFLVIMMMLFCVRLQNKTIIFGKYILVLGMLPLLVLIKGQAIISLLERGQGLENLLSLGGRTLFWERLISEGVWSPSVLYGFGYQMLSGEGRGSISAGVTISMAHNNFIQSFLGLGVIGLMLNIAFWVFVFRRIIRNRRFLRLRDYNLLITSSVMVFIYSIVEFGIFGPPNIIMPVFLVLLFAYTRQNMGFFEYSMPTHNNALHVTNRK